mgnify:CR=1 FL=1
MKDFSLLKIGGEVRIMKNFDDDSLMLKAIVSEIDADEGTVSVEITEIDSINFHGVEIFSSKSKVTSSANVTFTHQQIKRISNITKSIVVMSVY